MKVGSPVAKDPGTLNEKRQLIADVPRRVCIEEEWRASERARGGMRDGKRKRCQRRKATRGRVLRCNATPGVYRAALGGRGLHHVTTQTQPIAARSITLPAPLPLRRLGRSIRVRGSALAACRRSTALTWYSQPRRSSTEQRAASYSQAADALALRGSRSSVTVPSRAPMPPCRRSGMACQLCCRRSGSAAYVLLAM
eukprot:1317544-Rhodomonas_salina.5